MSAEGRRSRAGQLRPSGQHLLRSDELASEVVTQAGIRATDLVFEIGAGTGRITGVLAESAGRVVAIELDPGFAETLRRRFRARPQVDVVEADVLRVPLPQGPFRAFGNIPFGLTTAVLRRLLDDPTSALDRADLIVQHEVARKRSSVWPSDLLSLGWMPWWELHLVRHLPARAFDPPPSIDAGLLSITKRRQPLAAPELRNDYLAFVRAGFRRADLPVHRSLRAQLPEGLSKRTMRKRGRGPGAKARHLDVFDWVALFLLARRSEHR